MGNHHSSLGEDYRKALRRFNRGRLALVRSIFKNLTEASVSPGQTIDKDTFLQYFPLPGLLGERLYAMFDRDNSGGVDFQEFLTGLALIYRGTLEEKKRFLFEMYDLDGDGVVTREELQSMLLHIPAAFKILDAMLADKGCCSNWKTSGGEKEEVETQRRILQVIDTAFAFKGDSEQHLTFSEFRDVVTQTPGILEILEIFCDEALPENDCASRTSAITDSSLPRMTMWSTYHGTNQHLPQPSRPATLSMREVTGGSSLSAAVQPERPSSSMTTLARKLLPGWISATPSEASTAIASAVDASELICAASLEKGAASRWCPTCAASLVMAHCPLCGGALHLTDTAAQRCSSCSWELEALRFCFRCGSALQRSVEEADLGLGSTPSSPSSRSSSCCALKQLSSNGRFSTPLSSRPSSVGSASGDKTPPSADIRWERQLSPGSRAIPQRPIPLKQGTLWKIGRKAKMTRSYYFVLEDRFLYYYSRQSDRAPKGAIFLEGATVSADDSEGHRGKFGIAVQQRNTTRRRILLCAGAEERTEWLEALYLATRTKPLHAYCSLTDRELGRGKFASVFEGYLHDDEQTKVAVKVFSKADMSSEDREHIRTEVAILKLVDHPCVIRLLSVFDEPENLYLVMENIGGGDLLQHLRQLPGQHLAEPSARQMLPCLLCGVQYLHDLGITHRDLKPENILVLDAPEGSETTTRVSSVKITDFGLSAITGRPMAEPLGTVAYAAPEILLNRPYDKSVDIWSLGVVTFVVLCGQLPFKGESDREVAHHVVRGQYVFDHTLWRTVSSPARAFVARLLSHDPHQRPTASAAMEHAWLVLKDDDKPNVLQRW